MSPDLRENLPTDDLALPAVVPRLAAGRRVRPVWVNVLGGITVSFGDQHLKWSPPGGPDLDAERIRLAWAGAFTPVPAVVDHGENGEGQWLLTTTIRGRSAVAPRWRAEPDTAVRAIARGLRAWHDTLPVADCPFTWSADERRARATSSTPAPPPVDRLVVAHGDACAPNTLVDDDGAWAGHVDLGSLGVADRWADIAVALLSLGWNYGPHREAAFLEAYGVDPDPDRIAFYQHLWNATP